MQIHVGFTNNSQQISLSVDLTEAQIVALVATHCGADAPNEPLVLADTCGRQLIVAPGRLAYIETLPERTQKVGFGIG